MNDFSLKCWKAACDGQLNVSLGYTDQLTECVRCGGVDAFINMAVVNCPKCNHAVTLSLKTYNLLGALFCENCFLKIEKCEFETKLRIYPLSEFANDKMGISGGETLSYCGRDSFEGEENQVTYALSVLERYALSRSRTPLGTFPKSIFIRHSGGVNTDALNLPITEIRLLHGYCNFKFHSAHQNAKFSGTISDFGNGYLFKRLVDDYGLVNAFFEDKDLLEELGNTNMLQKYRRYLKML